MKSGIRLGSGSPRWTNLGVPSQGGIKIGYVLLNSVARSSFIAYGLSSTRLSSTTTINALGAIGRLSSEHKASS